MTDGACSVYCHGQTLEPAGAGGKRTRPRWLADPDGPMACDACHGAPPPPPHPHLLLPDRCDGCHPFAGLRPEDVATHINGTLEVQPTTCGVCHPLPPPVGAHATHLGEDLDPAAASYTDYRQTAELTGDQASDHYAFGCSNCHKGAEVPHPNGVLDLRLADLQAPPTSLKALNPPTATFADQRCADVYCHSDGKSPPTYVRSPSFDTILADAARCGACHANGGASTSLSGRHPAHTDAATYGFGCERCHTATASSSTAIADKARHVNGRVEVRFSQGGSYDDAGGACTGTYCHSDAAGGPPNQPVAFADAGSLACDACHNGLNGAPREMTSHGHERLVGSSWVRHYPCDYCHAGVADQDGNITDYQRHVNGQVDVVIAPQWSIVGNPPSSYDPVTRVCSDVYCHSDGTTVNPEIRNFAWTDGRTSCNTCHGHPTGACGNCHPQRTAWQPGEEWKSAMPMYPNSGTGTERANTHARHILTDFSCDDCHMLTVVNGACTDCHKDRVPSGHMSELSHINPAYHVNRVKDVAFKDGGTYDPVTKTCANTVCHTGDEPQWGDSANNAILCFTCHGTTEADVDDFNAWNSRRARINMVEWQTTGHGRPTAAGPYPSGNPAANFPGNPCWYCHDNKVLHKVADNPFRLKKHEQYNRRFEKECVFCHMEHQDDECRACHDAVESTLAPQLDQIPGPPDHAPYAGGGGSCVVAGCHLDDASTHKAGAGVWTASQKADVQNQYVMMGVCLQCHDGGADGQCTECHSGAQYVPGYDPGTGLVTAVSRATSTHFGYKHWNAYVNDGVWKGGKFCWDCHDPHGDANLYMIQKSIALTTDGTFGIPLTRREAKFTRKQTGFDYARANPPYDGVCNVCHSEPRQHYRYDYGDGHQAGRICTECHEHRFTDSHASHQACGTCHRAKPVPRHSGFSLPRDCVKCHAGVVGDRMNVMAQLAASSHHIQGTEVTGRHCYACHFEATEIGIINTEHHEGYDFQSHTSIRNAPVDLAIWGPGTRPPTFALGSTAVQFVAGKIGTVEERAEVAKVTAHCLSCHSDQNNDTRPFDVVDAEHGDCKTPRQYAWDTTSIASRYEQTATTPWGKYPGVAGAAPKSVLKAYSAHGHPEANEGGFSVATGVDGPIANSRTGTERVACFDCHSSHGSKTQGVTSSYVTFNGTKNGGNLKETQAGKGGYRSTYTAQAAKIDPNPYNAGAAQCFDCHETPDAGATPWGYASTFGESAPVMGYRDGPRFGDGVRGVKLRMAYKESRHVLGGHLKASFPLETEAMGTIDGLCTPCHDPHGVSPTLGANQAYAVPLLKGTWLTSPYKEDLPPPALTIQNNPPTPGVNIDQNTFGGAARIVETEEQFAGLCLRCHPKTELADGVNDTMPWRSLDRVHEAVKGWGDNVQHSFPCSKCHQPHASGLPELLDTNALDFAHRGRVPAGGVVGQGSRGSFPRGSGQRGVNCHPTGSWPDNSWNGVSEWEAP
ncbi:MAG: CxxxxCH/CxxCH domain-containing protein [Deltaproteobacteria bacterium]|nr:CxxxxCH/CxxCH domain-containing protein [Deltaproteobacteria bacterium]